MKSKDEVIDSLWERAGHGTRREDIVAAFEAGTAWAKTLVEEAQYADPSANINGTDWHRRAEEALEALAKR